MRRTVSVTAVLRVFLEDPAQPWYGFELTRQARVSAGMLYPILDQLERVDWVRRDRSAVPDDTNGQSRVSYRLTQHGMAAARLEMATLAQRSPASSIRRVALRPKPGTP